MAAETKTIYGQAYITGKSLVQDVIFLVVTNGGKNVVQSENTVIIIEDIWSDLLDKNGTSKKGRKGYWYWEVEMTDIDEPDHNVKMKIGCPKPGPEVFDYNYEPSENDSEWAAYWKEKMLEAINSPYNSTNAITPAEVTLPGTKYVDQNGDLITLNEVKVSRDGLSDVQNLMASLF